MEIIVADDDPSRSAWESIRRIAQSAPVPLRYVESGAQNISACRNVCLKTAKADWIAFIDDDQIAEPDWLREMISTAEKFRADAVKCYVRGIYPPETPDWMKAGGPYTYDYGPTGTEIRFGATCGILFRRDLPGSGELLFDVALGVMGGEDAEFFMRYKALGGKIVSCRSAIANEVVPVERVTSTYLRTRCRRHGHIHGRIVLTKKASVGRPLSIMKSVVGVTLTSPYAVVRMVHAAMGCRMFMKFWMHVGILDWVLGRDAFYHE
jgi:succinoglycan biosynthesis protein ExoM